MEQRRIKELVKKMSLEEKAGLCSGGDFWHTKGIERLNIPAVMMADGPFGLRKQDDKADHLGINESIRAVCFPAGVATASSFDRNLVRRLGETLGEECQAENLAILLGPAMNIKRSPLCGRNFEYYSEDPLVSTEMANAYIQGLQSRHIGASPKHFYANNMEERRMTASSEMDERTEREIYLSSFENAVKEAKPWTVMCAYNKINGTYAAENKQALTDILRDEWGFDGFVVSDWGAANDRVADLEAGMELEMPASGGLNDRKIVEAVQNDKLDERILNRACERLLSVVFKYEENRNFNAKYDLEAEHHKAGMMAAECMVMLKNDHILPLDKSKQIAFIGKYANKPRYQGGGSSHINAYKVESALDAVKGIAGIHYAQGFDDDTDDINPIMMEEAVRMAKKVDIAVLFVGLPDLYEAEGYDRKHMKLPPNQNQLIEAVCKVQSNVVVVLHNGSPIEMPWIDKVKGVLESYLAGQAVGVAQADILFGTINPSGKLAESFPLRLEDNPSYLNFCLQDNKVQYTEGVFVGYRYYDSRKMEVLFPFGHGLSYTRFEYSNLIIDQVKVKDTDIFTVSVEVQNTGSMYGKEVVQLYITPAECSVARPVQELKGFEKIALEPGQRKTISFELNKRAFAYWDVKIHDWYAATGEYGIRIGSSSRDIRLTGKVRVETTGRDSVVYTKDSAVGDLLANPEKAEIVQQMLAGIQQPDKGAEQSNDAMTTAAQQAMMMSMPLRALMSFGEMSEETLGKMLKTLNE